MGMGKVNGSIVFIGGTGRSGTSITRALLGAHPSVLTFPFEYRFIIDPDGIIDFINGFENAWSPFIMDKRIKRLEKFLKKLGKNNSVSNFLGSFIRSNNITKSLMTANSYHGWFLSKHFPNYFKHVDNLISNIEQFRYQGAWAGSDSFRLKNQIRYCPPYTKKELYPIFSEFFINLYGDLFSYNRKHILVEDNTWNLLFAKDLSRLFPTAKFVHVYRDPRDIVCSFSSQRWMPSDKIESAIICSDLLTKIQSELSQINPSRVLEIGLEDLVLDKKKSISSILQFIGLEESNDILNFPLESGSIDRWKTELNSAELLTIEPYLKPAADSLGYDW